MRIGLQPVARACIGLHTHPAGRAGAPSQAQCWAGNPPRVIALNAARPYLLGIGMGWDAQRGFAFLCRDPTRQTGRIKSTFVVVFAVLLCSNVIVTLRYTGPIGGPGRDKEREGNIMMYKATIGGAALAVTDTGLIPGQDGPGGLPAQH